jgi:CHAD domain-containing protein
MPSDPERSLQVFENVNRQLMKLAAKPAAGCVHKFRTNSRRVEALIAEVATAPNRNARKLLKLLAQLRKKAGRVRDVDVQIACLRNLKVPEAARHKTQLLRMLAEQRVRGEKKIGSAFDKATVRELRKRLRRAKDELSLAEGQLLALAKKQLATIAKGGALSEETLHQYRITGKRARYLAEMAGESAEATKLVTELRRMQDAIGDWHDWLKLTQKAEGIFGSVQESPLVAALRNVTRAKFRQALSEAADLRKELLEERTIPMPAASETKAAPARAAVA